MNNLYYIILCVWVPFVLHSQHKELLYGFQELPQSLMLNPGEENSLQFHAGIPLFSHFHLQAGIKGLSVYDIFADDGRSINDKIAATLDRLDNKDHIAINQQLEILQFGWRKKKDKSIYYTAGMYQEIDFIGYFPKDFATLAYSGNRDLINTAFRLSDIRANAELVSVFHFGYHKTKNKKWTYGFRGKLYSSIIHFRTNNNSGNFATLESPFGNNIYQHFLNDVDFSAKTSGYASLRRIDSENTADGSKQVLNKFLGRAFFSGNIGFGLDAGFTYRWEDQWAVSGSIRDFGYIYYAKDVEIYNAKGTYIFEGVETPINTGTAAQDFVRELEAAIPIDTLNTSYAAARSVKLHGGLRYAFNKYKDESCDCYVEGEDPPYMDAVGAQLFTQFRPKTPQFALSLFYYKRWTEFFRTKINYTLDDYSYRNVGILLSGHRPKFNFYISMNHLFEYSNLAKAQAASISFGVNIIR